MHIEKIKVSKNNVLGAMDLIGCIKIQGVEIKSFSQAELNAPFQDRYNSCDPKKKDFIPFLRGMEVEGRMMNIQLEQEKTDIVLFKMLYASREPRHANFAMQQLRHRSATIEELFVITPLLSQIFSGENVEVVATGSHKRKPKTLATTYPGVVLRKKQKFNPIPVLLDSGDTEWRSLCGENMWFTSVPSEINWRPMKIGDEVVEINHSHARQKKNSGKIISFYSGQGVGVHLDTDDGKPCHLPVEWLKLRFR